MLKISVNKLLKHHYLSFILTWPYLAQILFSLFQRNVVVKHFCFNPKKVPAIIESFHFGFGFWLFSGFYPLSPHPIKWKHFSFKSSTTPNKAFHMVFNPHEITFFHCKLFCQKIRSSQGKFKLISFFSLCISVTVWWGAGAGSASLLFILLVHKIKEQKKKVWKILCLFKRQCHL